MGQRAQTALTMIDPGVLAHFLADHGVLIVFLLSLLEGPIVTLCAGFLAAQGLIGLAAVYVAAVAGDLAGDVIVYGAGRWLLDRLPGYALRQRVDGLRRYVAARPGRVLLFGKLTHSAGYAVLLTAGAGRMRFGAFVLYNLLGTIPKSALLAGAGYGFGRLYQTLAGDLRLAGLLGVVVVCLVMIPMILRMEAPHHPDRLE